MRYKQIDNGRSKKISEYIAKPNNSSWNFNYNACEFQQSESHTTHESKATQSWLLHTEPQFRFSWRAGVTYDWPCKVAWNRTPSYGFLIILFWFYQTASARRIRVCSHATSICIWMLQENIVFDKIHMNGHRIVNSYDSSIRIHYYLHIHMAMRMLTEPLRRTG